MSCWVIPLTPLSCLHLFCCCSESIYQVNGKIWSFHLHSSRGQISWLCVKQTSGKLDCSTNSIHSLMPLCSWQHKNIFWDIRWCSLLTCFYPCRKMMDSGQIDFYQHDTVCSNTCRSTKFDVLINSTRLPSGTLVQPGPSCLALDLIGTQLPSLTGRL